MLDPAPASFPGAGAGAGFEERDLTRLLLYFTRQCLATQTDAAERCSLRSLAAVRVCKISFSRLLRST